METLTKIKIVIIEETAPVESVTYKLMTSSRKLAGESVLDLLESGALGVLFALNTLSLLASLEY